MARVAFILDELFEDSEFQVPYDRVRDAGHEPVIVGLRAGKDVLTRDMHQALKPVAAICHAGWMLAEADIVRGKTVTSYHSIKTDLRNAGADWVDQELVEAVSDAGGNIITSRHPGDLPAFCEALLRQLK
jgi:protease I